MNNTTRILYVTDVHGSEQCWRKFLKASTFYKNVDVLILGGDLTGKIIVPIIEQPDGSWFASYNKDYRLKKEEEVKDLERILRFSGAYPFRCTPEDTEELENDEKKLNKLFEKLIVENIEYWVSLVPDRVPEDVKIFVSPGNDDSLLVDDVLKKDPYITYPLDKVVQVDKHHEMISLEWVNPSPWNSPRECVEEELRKKIDELFTMVDGGYENLICNLHAPPLGSGLDSAPRLDENLRPKFVLGHIVIEPVGSKAVRDAIGEYQPKMGLHGHIHESAGTHKVGRTVCINPGSEYGEGILRGYLIDLEPNKITRYWGVRG